MVRTPFQEKNTMAINKSYLMDTPYDIVACTGFVPIPGCDVWNDPDKYNIEILSRNLREYNFYFFGPYGKRPLDKIFKIKTRSLSEFHQESEDFRCWLEQEGRLNEG